MLLLNLNIHKGCPCHAHSPAATGLIRCAFCIHRIHRGILKPNLGLLRCGSYSWAALSWTAPLCMHPVGCFMIFSRYCTIRCRVQLFRGVTHHTNEQNHEKSLSRWSRRKHRKHTSPVAECASIHWKAFAWDKRAWCNWPSQCGKWAPNADIGAFSISSSP